MKMEETMCSRMQVALRNWKQPQLTASKEMETSTLQPQGTELGQ